MSVTCLSGVDLIMDDLTFIRDSFYMLFMYMILSLLFCTQLN